MANKRLVQPGHHLLGAFAAYTNDHAVWLEEIIHGVAFPQKFRVGYHIEFYAGVRCNCCCDFFGSAHGHGALVYNNLVLGHHPAQLICHTQDITQVGAAIFIGRRGQGQENDLSGLNGLRQICGKGEPAGFDVPFEQHIQVRLVNGNLSIAHALHFGRIDVDANDIVSSFGETSTGYKADITRSDYSNLHSNMV